MVEHLWGAAAIALVSAPSGHTAVVMRAQILDIRELPAVAHPEGSEHGRIDADNDDGDQVEVDLQVRSVLVGDFNQKSFTTVLRMRAWPYLPALRDIYLVGTVDSAGRFSALRWSHARNGLCVPDLMAKELGIERDIAALEAKGIVNC